MRVLIVTIGDLTKAFEAKPENRRSVHNLTKAANHLGFYCSAIETELKQCDAPTPKTPDGPAD